MTGAGAVEAVISDFGGVLTSPLRDAFEFFQESSGVSLEALGLALAAVASARGTNPLFELESGRLSEADFLGAIGERLSEQVGRPVSIDDFGQRLFAQMQPNRAMIDYLHELRGRGHRLALCTNNVREWSDRWRALVPVDELFEVVVDSAFVGTRKPERRIYELTLERLGVAAERTVFIDDIEDNCTAAAAVGMRTVWFRETEQAIADTEAILAGDG